MDKYLEYTFVGALTLDQAEEVLLQSKIECYINLHKDYYGFKPRSFVRDDEYGITCWEVDELIERILISRQRDEWENLSTSAKNAKALAEHVNTSTNNELRLKLLAAQ
jgi:hypothetical protein